MQFRYPLIERYYVSCIYLYHNEGRGNNNGKCQSTTIVFEAVILQVIVLEISRHIRGIIFYIAYFDLYKNNTLPYI